MKEEKIIITINEDGSLELKSVGIKGEACMGEIEALLSEDMDIKSDKKTDEYYQKVSQTQQVTLRSKK